MRAPRWVTIRPVLVAHDGLLVLGWTHRDCVGACRVRLYRELAVKLSAHGRGRSALSATRAADEYERKHGCPPTSGRSAS